MLGANSFFSSESLESSDTVANPELNRRLGLYQLFLKLYDQRRELLDEILDLENSGHKTLTSKASLYVQGVISNDQIHLVSNLANGQTQALIQPQQIWTIGRDSRRVMISIPDKRLSRCHAAIQYCGDQKFQLIDFNSTNGSFVNGELVKHITPLEDGDQIRLGSLTFSFFGCYTQRILDEISPELLDQITGIQKSFIPRGDRPSNSDIPSEKIASSGIYSPEKTLMFLRNKNSNPV
ncbi:MAG: FHA domain-containing protein [Oculatellaceae cyanobacterium bins.114]|nr:FHA domain-containing protein [Oculatellaceae cyanobacterium bins.114]